MVHRPLLKGRKTGFTHRLAVVLLTLVEQPVAHQQVNTALPYLNRRDHGYTLRAALSESFYTAGGGADGGHLASRNYTTSEGLIAPSEASHLMPGSFSYHHM